MIEHINYEFPATFESVDICCLKLKDFLESHHLDNLLFKSEILAREAMNNAVIHGSQVTGNFIFNAEITQDYLIIRVKDGGLGFESTSENIDREGGDNTRGRGYLIFQKYSSDFSINNAGNEIELKIEVVK